MVRINATFAIMRVFFCRTPSSFVHEHVEHKAVFIKVETLQVVVQVRTMQQTVRDKVVLNAFILEVKIDVGNRLKVF